MKNVAVLFVCYGNICRSPTAEAVCADLLKKEGMAKQVRVSSAGTSSFHTGEAPDKRAQAAAAARGYALSHLRARAVCAEDYYIYDHILAMDEDNLAVLRRMKPADAQVTPRLFLEYGGRLAKEKASDNNVPDPYYSDGFSLVLDLVEEAGRNFVRTLRNS